MPLPHIPVVRPPATPRDCRGLTPCASGSGSGARQKFAGGLSLLVAAVLGMGLFAGCGRSPDVPLAPVSGRVFFHGRPVPAELLFQPLSDSERPAGRPSTGVANSDGQYTLHYTSEFPGALLGRHAVVVKILPYADEGEPTSFAAASTPLKVVRLIREVREGRNEMNFAITY